MSTLDFTRLPQEAIDEFKSMFLKEFGIDLSNEEALEQGTNLMELYRLALEEAYERVRTEG